MRIDDEDYDISDEFLRELTEKYSDINHPLFMDELPNDISSNSDLEALHKLLSEGETRDSIAKKYKEVGNGYVSEGRRYYEAAISSYTDGIAAESKDNVLNSQLYSNRALVYLRLDDYVKCVNDCRRSITYDVYNYKSYYRGAIASYKLSLYKQALLFCNECAKAITLDPEIKVFESEKNDNYKLLCIIDDKFGSFYKKILAKYNEFEMEKSRIRQNQEKEKEKKKLAEEAAKEFLKLKGLKLCDNLFQIPESQTVVFYLKDNAIHTSCLFVYDQVDMSDYIQDFDYNSSISDHLDVMFGEGERFSSKNSLCFYQVSPDEVMKFDLHAPLEEVALKSGFIFKVPVVHIVTDEDALTGFTKI